MNAPAKIETAGAPRGALKAQMDSLHQFSATMRHGLFNGFNELELALSRFPGAPPTLGQKLTHWLKATGQKEKDPEAQRLIDARNLLVHAVARVVSVDGEPMLWMRVADKAKEHDSLVLARPQLERWKKDVEALQRRMAERIGGTAAGPAKKKDTETQRTSSSGI